MVPHQNWKLQYPGTGRRLRLAKVRAGVGLPLPDHFDRNLNRCLVDMPALGAFEDPQIRTIATGFDAGQHRAALARLAERPQHWSQH
jgi:hypothetical protein